MLDLNVADALFGRALNGSVGILFHFLPYGKGGESGQGEDAPTGQMLGSIDDTGHGSEEQNDRDCVQKNGQHMGN